MATSKDDEKKAAALRKKLDEMRKAVNGHAASAQKRVQGKSGGTTKLPPLGDDIDAELPDLTPGLD